MTTASLDRARAGFLMALLAPPIAAWATDSVSDAGQDEPRAGTLETVAELPVNPGNLAVTADGRIFATVHQFRPADARLIEVTGETAYAPWPNAAWNGAFASGPDVLNAPLGIQIDDRERLWVLDNGLPLAPDQEPQAPKLVAFSIADGDLVFRHDFSEDTGPAGSFLNDLAVDAERGFVYIADVGGSAQPALVTLDLNTGSARRFTASEALAAEDVDLVIDGRTLGSEDDDGSLDPARVALNPITLSADGETLFFGAMSGETWYRLPARLLRDGASDGDIAAAIEPVGRKPVSDGASTDAAGNHYFTDLGRNAIGLLGADGEARTLVRDQRLSWPDALSFGEPRWLYVAVNQLHLSPPLNNGVEGGGPPFLILRLRTEDAGLAGR